MVAYASGPLYFQVVLKNLQNKDNIILYNTDKNTLNGILRILSAHKIAE